MTKLTYKVEGIEYTTYAQALTATKGGRYRLHRIYTSVPEEYPVNEERRARRIAAIRRHAREKASAN